MQSASTDRLTRAQWILLFILAGVQFTNVLDFVIMMPLAPQFHDQWNLTPQQFGMLVSTYAYAAAISGLLSTFFIDRLDRKVALMGIYLGFALGNWFCAEATSFTMMLCARALVGVFGGALGGMVLAIVGDVIPAQRRGLATGIIMTSFSVASIVGIPLGLFLAEQFNWRWPFYLLAAFSALLLVVCWFLLPMLRSHLQHHDPRRAPWQTTWSILTDSQHLRAYLLMAFLVMTTFMIVPYLPSYLVENVGMQREHIKWIYFTGGIATFACMAPIGRLADRYGKLLVYQILAILTVFPVLLITHLPAVPLAVILTSTTLLMVITSSRSVPAMAMITGCTTPERRGGFMSVLGSVQQLSMGLATTLAGFILGVRALPESAAFPGSEPTHPLEGFHWVGWIGTATTLITVYLATLLRSADGKKVVSQPAPPKAGQVHSHSTPPNAMPLATEQ